MHADRISLRARDVPLCAVLTALAAETGITIYGHVADEQRTSVQFERQRLTRVLDRLLGDGGYLLVLTDAHARLTRLDPHARACRCAARRGCCIVRRGAAMPAATDSAESVAREAAVNERRARREAVESAAELDDAAAASLLTSALADADAGVREIAVETLAMLDTPNARELLHAAMQDTDPDVRLEVIDSLGDLDDVRSTTRSSVHWPTQTRECARRPRTIWQSASTERTRGSVDHRNHHARVDFESGAAIVGRCRPATRRNDATQRIGLRTHHTRLAEPARAKRVRRHLRRLWHQRQRRQPDCRRSAGARSRGRRRLAQPGQP